MNVYLLMRTRPVGLDEFRSKVIIAANKEEARKLANIKVGDEGKIWKDVYEVLCMEVSMDEPSIVLADFNVG